jgi:hypothetical protein
MRPEGTRAPAARTPAARLRSTLMLVAMLATPCAYSDSLHPVSRAQTSTAEGVAALLEPLVFTGPSADAAALLRSRLVSEESRILTLIAVGGERSDLSRALLADLRDAVSRSIRPMQPVVSERGTAAAVVVMGGWVRMTARSSRMIEASTSSVTDIERCLAALRATRAANWTAPQGDPVRRRFVEKLDGAMRDALYGLPMNPPAAIEAGDMPAAERIVRDACRAAAEFLAGEEKRIEGRAPDDPWLRVAFMDGFGQRVEGVLDEFARDVNHGLAELLGDARSRSVEAAAAQAAMELDQFMAGDLSDVQGALAAADSLVAHDGFAELEGDRNADGTLFRQDIEAAQRTAGDAASLGLQMLAEILSAAAIALDRAQDSGDSLHRAEWVWTRDGDVSAVVRGVVGRVRGSCIVAFGFVRMKAPFEDLLPGPTDRLSGALIRWDPAKDASPESLKISWPDEGGKDTANGWDGGGCNAATPRARLKGKLNWISESEELRVAMASVLDRAWRGATSVTPAIFTPTLVFDSGRGTRFTAAVDIRIPNRTIRRAGDARGAVRLESEEGGEQSTRDRCVEIKVERETADFKAAELPDAGVHALVCTLEPDLEVIRLIGRSEARVTQGDELLAAARSRWSEGDKLAAFLLEDAAMVIDGQASVSEGSGWPELCSRIGLGIEHPFRLRLDEWRAKFSGTGVAFAHTFRWMHSVPSEWFAGPRGIASKSGESTATSESGVGR